MGVGATILRRLRNGEGIFGRNILGRVNAIVDAVIDSLLNFADAAGNKLPGLFILFLEDVVLKVKFIIGLFVIFNLVFVLLLFPLHLFDHMQQIFLLLLQVIVFLTKKLLYLFKSLFYFILTNTRMDRTAIHPAMTLPIVISICCASGLQSHIFKMLLNFHVKSSGSFACHHGWAITLEINLIVFPGSPRFCFIIIFFLSAVVPCMGVTWLIAVPSCVFFLIWGRWFAWLFNEFRHKYDKLTNN